MIVNIIINLTWELILSEHVTLIEETNVYQSVYKSPTIMCERTLYVDYLTLLTLHLKMC